MKSTGKTRDPDFVGAEVAMHRAAERVRRRVQEATGVVPVFRDGQIILENSVRSRLHNCVAPFGLVSISQKSLREICGNQSHTVQHGTAGLPIGALC